MTLVCWNCGTPQNEPPFGKLPFRAECEKCGSALHCCKNCRFFKPGLPNDCMVPGTEFISDREANNLCEEFKVLGIKTEKKSSDKDPFNNLFKD